MARVTVGTKIAAGFATALLIFLLVGVVSYRSTVELVEASNSRRQTFETLSALTDILAVMQDVQIGQRSYALTGDERALEPYRLAVGGIDALFSKLEALTAGDAGTRNRIEALERLVRDHLTFAAETVDVTRVKGQEAGIAMIRTGEGQALTDGIRMAIADIDRQQSDLLGQRIGESQANADRARMTIVVGTLLAMIVAALAGFVIARNIARPLRELTLVAERVTVGDLSVIVASDDRSDEVGVLARAFERMTRSLRAMASAAEQIAAGDLRSTVTPQSPDDVLGHAFARMIGNLREQTEQLIEGAAVVGAATSEIVASSTQLAASASQSAAAVSETTTTVEEVRQTAELASQKAKYVADSAQKAAEISQAGRKSTADAAAGMDRIRQQMEAIASSMTRLSEQSQTIGQIIATVEDLATQSNLLAVNAAIEAAKAGEHGKGFGVVAQEVKSLAEQSRQATGDVRTILSDIQKASMAAVLATEQGSKAVEAGARQTELAGESIHALGGSVTDAAQAAMQIATSSQQQLIGVDQVALAMESIKQASTQNVVGARQLESAARNLSELGERLKQIVGRYNV